MGCGSRQYGPDCGTHRAPEGLSSERSQSVAIDRSVLTERVGHFGEPELLLVLAGIDLVLGHD